MEQDRERHADQGRIKKNKDRAVVTDSVLIRALMKNTRASGARMNIHISGLCSSAGPMN